jgi:hypothetical protein
MERMPSLRAAHLWAEKEHEKALLGKERANSQPYHHKRPVPIREEKAF